MPKGTKMYSDKQEKLVASFMSDSNSDWKQVTGSGARPNFPGDVISKDWLCECKTHTKPYQPIIFVFKVWDKICEEASGIFRKPVLVTDDGSQTLEKTYCLTKIGLISADSNNTGYPNYTNKYSYRKSVNDIEKQHGLDYVIYKDQLLLICRLSVFKELISRKVL